MGIEGNFAREILRRAKTLGHEWYDLWGIAPENRPDDTWVAISVFKRKFGGLELNLVPTLDYVYEPRPHANCVATKGDPGED